MQTGRDEMVGVLAAHQQETDNDGAVWWCTCGEAPDTADIGDGQEFARWMAEHQAAMLAAASIYPFRPTHAHEDTAAATATCREHDAWVDDTTHPKRRVLRPCRRTQNHPGYHEALNTDGTPHRWRREERDA